MVVVVVVIRTSDASQFKKKTKQIKKEEKAKERK